MLVDLRSLSFIHKLIPFPELPPCRVPPPRHLLCVSFYVTLGILLGFNLGLEYIIHF